MVEVSKIQINWSGKSFHFEKEANLFDAYLNRNTTNRFGLRLIRHDRFLVGYGDHTSGAIWIFAWFWESCLFFKGVFSSSDPDRSGILVVKANHLDAPEICTYLRFEIGRFEDFCFVDTHKMFEVYIRNFLSG
jgi:hypothetical protein